MCNLQLLCPLTLFYSWHLTQPRDLKHADTFQNVSHFIPCLLLQQHGKLFPFLCSFLKEIIQLVLGSCIWSLPWFSVSFSWDWFTASIYILVSAFGIQLYEISVMFLWKSGFIIRFCVRLGSLSSKIILKNFLNLLLYGSLYQFMFLVFFW